MLTYPDIDKVAFELGPVAVHWYGLMYLVGFACAWWLGRRRARDEWRGWQPAQVDDLVFYAALGVVLGGRLGFVVFYDFPAFLDDPIRLLKIWQGGMSFHGGLIGVLVAMTVCARRHRRKFFEVTDFLAPLVPIGLGAGRIGNFINGELWGRPSEVPWAMVVPGSGAPARHPSQLYEAALEGGVLFVILWWFSARSRPTMAVSGAFLAGYGVFRSLVEVVRVPDAALGYLAWGWLTMGQLLSFPMILIGAWMVATAYSRSPTRRASAG